MTITQDQQPKASTPTLSSRSRSTRLRTKEQREQGAKPQPFDTTSTPPTTSTTTKAKRRSSSTHPEGLQDKVTARWKHLMRNMPDPEEPPEAKTTERKSRKLTGDSTTPTPFGGSGQKTVTSSMRAIRATPVTTTTPVGGNNDDYFDNKSETTTSQIESRSSHDRTKRTTTQGNSNKTSHLASAASSKPHSTPALPFNGASDSTSSSTSTSLPSISTSHAITRHQAKVSKEAQQDYITFSTGLDGTLTTPDLADSPAVSNSRKRTSTITEQHKSSSSSQSYTRSRSQSQSASITSNSHYKKRRVQLTSKPQSSPSSSSSSAPPVVTRSRSRVSGSLNRETRDLARYLRQSKMSTSQKRSTISKSSFKVADIMDATTAKDGTDHSPLQDTEQSTSSEGVSKDHSAEKE
ncbi:hypothetical protein BGX29_002193, partial [Mortierella sp. GBA35]